MSGLPGRLSFDRLLAHVPTWRRTLIRRTQQSWWFVILTIGLVAFANALAADRAGWLALLFQTLAIVVVTAGIGGGILSASERGERIHRTWGRGWLLGIAGWIGFTVAVWFYLAGLGIGSNAVSESGPLSLISWPSGWLGAAIVGCLAMVAVSFALADVLRFTEDVAQRRAQELESRGRRFATAAPIIERMGDEATDPATEYASDLNIAGIAKAFIELLLEIPLVPAMRITLEAAARTCRKQLVIIAAVGGIALAVALALRSNGFTTIALLVALACVILGWTRVRRILELDEDLRGRTYMQATAQSPCVIDLPGISKSSEYLLDLVTGGSLTIDREIALAVGLTFAPIVAYAWSSQLIFEIRAPSGRVLYRAAEYAHALAKPGWRDQGRVLYPPRTS